jgi:hypothetical protein
MCPNELPGFYVPYRPRLNPIWRDGVCAHQGVGARHGILNAPSDASM